MDTHTIIIKIEYSSKSSSSSSSTASRSSAVGNLNSNTISSQYINGYGSIVNSNSYSSYSSHSKTSGYSSSSTYSTYSEKGSTIEYIEDKIVCIPAHSAKYFGEFQVSSTVYRECGFPRNPSKKEETILESIERIQASTQDILVDSQKLIDELYNKLYPYTQVSNDDKEKHIQDIKQKQLEKDSQSSDFDVDKVHTEKSGSTSSVEQMGDNNELVPESEQEQKYIDMTLCPECGSALVLRTAKRGENKGKQFYGCSAFPKCHYIKNLSTCQLKKIIEIFIFYL